jgi:two-component system heavy metal sensor histidine kinase CusS
MLSSIKLRLTALFLAISFVTLSGLGFFLYYQLESITVGSIDTHLHSEVQLIAGLVEVEQGRARVDLHEIAVGDYAVPLSGHYFQVVEGKPSGFRVVGRSPSLAHVDASLPFNSLHFEAIYETVDGPAKKHLRLSEQSFIIDGLTVTIQASESLKDTQLLLASYRNSLLIILPAVFILCAVAVFLLSRFSLLSLNVFSAKVGAITERSLNERLDTNGLPSELRPLADNFNTMMSRLEKSFEGQRRFLSDASHQLRTPAAVIKGYCDVTLGRDREGVEYRQSLEKINDAVVRMSSIIERILESARVDGLSAGEGFNKELDLHDVVADALRLFKERAIDGGVSLSFKGEHLKVSGDRKLLVEAVSNVIDNAIKYNHKGGSVLVELCASKDTAVLTVDDTGSGIEEEARSRIFERFYRSDEVSADIGGSGLGLSIVRSILAMHDATIDYEQSRGGGSRFILRFPLTQ